MSFSSIFHHLCIRRRILLIPNGISALKKAKLNFSDKRHCCTLSKRNFCISFSDIGLIFRKRLSYNGISMSLSTSTSEVSANDKKEEGRDNLGDVMMTEDSDADIVGGGNGDSGAAADQEMASGTLGEKNRIISEGKVQIPQGTNIFYNPTQEFNRDISILAIQTFINSEDKKDVQILEAMSASGIRAVRYAKEIQGITKVIANDYSAPAVETIRRNAERNGVEHLVEPSFGDACTKMYHEINSPVIVDLDPYGTPTPFLDAAVQCVHEGGMLLVTATDMAVLAGGNHAESCFAKYGSMSVKSKACHEIALRILAHTVQSTANRYGRVAIPLLSLSVDFYVRLFFKIIKSPRLAKKSALKTSMIYQCTGCRSISLQPLAAVKKNNITFAQGPPVPRKCEICDSSHHLGGPIWSAPIHDHDFVDKMIAELNQNYSYLGTFNRIKGMLGIVKEELLYSPLYYEVPEICSVVKSSSMPMAKIRSAILNLGYKVSGTHAEPNTIKSDIPNKVLWDILRAWRKETNPNPMREDTPGFRLMGKEPTIKSIDFTIHPDATPPSRHMNLLRYQVNPQKFWGPGCRDSFKSHEDGAPTKKELNQGKKKRLKLSQGDSLRAAIQNTNS